MKSLNKEYSEMCYILGLILTVVGFIYLIPIIVGVFENNGEPLAFIVPFIIMETLGIGLKKLFRNHKNSVLTYQQAAVSVVLSWVITMIVSVVPFIMIASLTFSQAMFESVSGWTTTGLSMVEVANLPNSLLLFRSLMQFAGGFGLVAIMISSLIGIGALSTLYESEGHDQLLPNIKKTAQVLFAFYVTFMVLGVVAYIMSGMPLFDAINHSMSAISTGGFSIRDESIGFYNNRAIEIITIVLMLLGSLNFAAYVLLYKKKFKLFRKINENRFMTLLIVFASILLLYSLITTMFMSFTTAARITMFEIISAATTTGYSISDYSMYFSTSIIIFITLMIIGGQSGSTSGGIKVTRINLVVRNFLYSIRRVFHPEHRITDNVINIPSGSKQIHKGEMNNIYNYIFIYFVTLVIGTFILSLEGFGLQDSLFEFASTIGTVGLSVGITSANLSNLSYWAMILGMFLGRLEFIVVIIVFVKLFIDAKTLVFKRK